MILKASSHAIPSVSGCRSAVRNIQTRGCRPAPPIAISQLPSSKAARSSPHGSPPSSQTLALMEAASHSDINGVADEKREDAVLCSRRTEMRSDSGYGDANGDDEHSEGMGSFLKLRSAINCAIPRLLDTKVATPWEISANTSSPGFRAAERPWFALGEITELLRGRGGAAYRSNRCCPRSHSCCRTW